MFTETTPSTETFTLEPTPITVAVPVTVHPTDTGFEVRIANIAVGLFRNGIVGETERRRFEFIVDKLRKPLIEALNTIEAARASARLELDGVKLSVTALKKSVDNERELSAMHVQKMQTMEAHAEQRARDLLAILRGEPYEVVPNISNAVIDLALTRMQDLANLSADVNVFKHQRDQYEIVCKETSEAIGSHDFDAHLGREVAVKLSRYANDCDHHSQRAERLQREIQDAIHAAADTDEDLDLSLVDAVARLRLEIRNLRSLMESRPDKSDAARLYLEACVILLASPGQSLRSVATERMAQLRAKADGPESLYDRAVEKAARVLNRWIP